MDLGIIAVVSLVFLVVSFAGSLTWLYYVTCRPGGFVNNLIAALENLGRCLEPAGDNGWKRVQKQRIAVLEDDFEAHQTRTSHAVRLANQRLARHIEGESEEETKTTNDRSGSVFDLNSWEG